MSTKTLTWLQKPWILPIIYALLAILASVQAIALGEKQFLPDGPFYSHYNNYVIFKRSWFHLIQGQDLFILYPAEHWDLYKYSPTFAQFFGLFAYLPDLLGLALWNLLNALVLWWGIVRLPGLKLGTAPKLGLFVAIELMTSLQNAQSNALLAGLLLLAFTALEERKYAWALFLIMGTVYIKIFGVVALALCLFYPQKWKMALWGLFWAAVFFVLPLVLISWEQLIFLYQSWGRLLQDDHTISYGFSVMGSLHAWLGVEPSKMLVLGTGVVLFCLPLLRIDRYKDLQFRLLLLASVLIWVIIFNHKAESATFVVAMCGAGIWYFCREKPEKWALALLILAFVFTSLSPTDLFPKLIRKNYLEPLMVKALPCILIWAVLIGEMVGGRGEKSRG
jgi:hypothetical protein